MKWPWGWVSSAEEERDWGLWGEALAARPWRVVSSGTSARHLASLSLNFFVG